LQRFLGRLGTKLGVLRLQVVDRGEIAADGFDPITRPQENPLHRVQHGFEAAADGVEHPHPRIDDDQQDRQQGEEGEAGARRDALIE
jgi:hypothetical protein